MKLTGLRALVTGGAQGIGRATVIRLLNEGCRVVIWDKDLAPLKDNPLPSEHDAMWIAKECDVTKEKEVGHLAEELFKELGGLDILVNNAGILIPGTFLEQTEEQRQKIVDVNLKSLMTVTVAFLPAFYEQNFGRVVNISSASGFLGVPGIAVYSATKWAVWGLTEALRHEALNAGKKGVLFSTVHPNFIAKGMFEGARLGGLGRIFFPKVKDHDVIAKAVVIYALKGGRNRIIRPRSARFAIFSRGILPDGAFQKVIRFFGAHESMNTWQGGKGEKK